MKNLLKGTAIVLFVTVALAVGLELALRAFTTESSFTINVDTSWVGQEMAIPDPLLGYRLKPGKRTAEYDVNSLGYRGPEFHKEKAPGVFRILCVGGSTTIGSNAGSDAFTYPRLLEDMLSRALSGCSGRVEVINAGVFGYHSWHSLARLPELMELKPDMLVMMDGLNDVMAAYSLSMSDLAASKLRRDKAMGSLVNAQARTSGALLWVARLRTLQAAAWLANVIERHTPLSFGMMRWKMQKFGFEENQEALLREAKAGGVPALLVNYPWISREGVPLESEKGRNPYGFTDDNFYRLYQFGRSYLKGANERLAARLNLPLADPQPAFDALTQDGSNARTVFSDNMHYTRYGNLLLARTVLETLVTLPEFQAFASKCEGFNAGYDQLDFRAAYKDIFQWGRCQAEEKKNPFCMYDVVPKVSGMAMSNLTVRPSLDGWSEFGVLDPSRPGVLRCSVNARGFPWRRAALLPRVNNAGDSIVVRLLNPGQEAVLLDFSKKDGTNGWTPMKEPVTVSLPGDQVRWDLEITFKGGDAQLWTYNYSILFPETIISD